MVQAWLRMSNRVWIDVVQMQALAVGNTVSRQHFAVVMAVSVHAQTSRFHMIAAPRERQCHETKSLPIWTNVLLIVELLA